MDTLSNPSPLATVRPRCAAPEGGQRYLTVQHARCSADVEVYTPVGDVDFYTVPLLRRALREAEQRHMPRVFVDLSQTGFLAVAGVRVLITAAQRSRATHRQLALVAATRPVRRVLEVTGALTSLVSYDSLSDAVAALSIPQQPMVVA